jgi:hypothetical protein
MSLGLSESRNRRRRQGRMIIILLRWLFVIAVAVGAGYYAWDFGTELARKEVRVLQTQLAQANADSAQLRTDITGLETALREERGLVAQWRDRYEAEVPKPEDAALLRAIQDRIGNGVSRERPTIRCRSPMLRSSSPPSGNRRSMRAGARKLGSIRPNRSPCISPGRAARPHRQRVFCRYIMRWWSAIANFALVLSPAAGHLPRSPVAPVFTRRRDDSAEIQITV